jgi:glucosamine 6-phosphate synthetase-like amidotransferase/phosphosugar isomerase protein
LAQATRLTVSACGTAFYAGLVAKYWFEQLARLHVEVDIASELRYREAPLPEGGAALFISQSGETVDTLAALRFSPSSMSRKARSPGNQMRFSQPLPAPKSVLPPPRLSPPS